MYLCLSAAAHQIPLLKRPGPFRQKKSKGRLKTIWTCRRHVIPLLGLTYQYIQLEVNQDVRTKKFQPA